jgi:hypothetical protein
MVMSFSPMVIDYLRKKMGECPKESCVVWFYCDYRDEKLQEPTKMLEALLKQTVFALRLSHGIPLEITEPLMEKKKKNDRFEEVDVFRILANALGRFKKAYICIDALDECQNERNRGDFLGHLRNLLPGNAVRGHSVQIFVTGRPHVEVDVKGFLLSDPGSTLSVKLEASTHDIMQYVAHEIEKDSRMGKVVMKDDFKKEIFDEITKHSGGM